MAISPIMGIGSYGSVASVQPMNYSVENTAQVSDVYNAETTKQSAGVNGAAPVQYPNAQVQSKSFNDIAAQFTSNNTSYTTKGVGTKYGMVGSKFDAYA